MAEKKISLLKRLNYLLNIAIGSVISVFIGNALYTYWEYGKYSGLYDMQSAPWYTSIIVRGVAVMVIVFIVIILKCMIKKKQKADN